MDSNPTADPDSAKPMRVDNLKMIGGIGPGIENRLHRAGILTFEQLADRTPDEIGALVAGVIGLTPEHIRDMNWIGKAQDLAARQAKSDRPADDAAANGRQHYASFTMELLLDEANSVRRTRLVHVQTGHKDTWPGWDGTRLLDCVIRRSELHIPAAEPSGHDDHEAIEPFSDRASVTEPVAPPELPIPLAGELQRWRTYAMAVGR